MPSKSFALQRAWRRDGAGADRPIMLAIAGDSAAGKTTITKGLVNALGPDRITSICVDDYHRYDRTERKELAAQGETFTPLSPRCNYLDIMEQHLQLLAVGQPILKPVYNHRTGTLDRPVLVEPREFVIIEGLLPIHSKLTRACFDCTVYLDPPEPVRFHWKIKRDTGNRGYIPDEVRADLARREVESAAYIRPQRSKADVVIRFSPIADRGELAPELVRAFEPATPRPEAVGDLDAHRAAAIEEFNMTWEAMERWQQVPTPPLSATLLLRPTIPHPDLTRILTDSHREAMHIQLNRDESNKPVDALHIHSYADRETTRDVEKEIWEELGVDDPIPESLGEIDAGSRSEPLAIAQLILLYHLFQAREG